VAAGGGLEAVGGVGVGLETGDGWGSEWAWLKRLNACTIARTRVQRTWKEKKILIISRIHVRLFVRVFDGVENE